LTYEVNYTISGIITIDADSPKQVEEIMLASHPQEIIGSLDPHSLKVTSITIDGHSGSEFDPDTEEYVRRAV